MRIRGAYSGGLQCPPFPQKTQAAKFTLQRDAHMRTNAQIKFLYYPLIDTTIQR